jgi:carbon-monoxide dehydrogenase large subunit/6-hydroxypseudooxynicotine dehydrogenase subunit gamma
MGSIGERAGRLEDRRLLRGTGRFVDDVDLAGQLAMRVIRSDAAHARIRSIDADAARRMPGVALVLTGADVAHVERIPLRIDLGVDLDRFLQPVLAQDRVRYVGEPVAVVLAENAYLAEDAAALVRVSYDPLPVVLDAEAAIAEGATSLREEGGNEAACIHKSYGDVAGAFAAADHVVAADLSTGRHSGIPMETRGMVARYDAGREHLTVWGASLVTHYHRRALARLLGMPVERIHMRSTDVGGSFGVRGDFFGEDFLVAHLARLTGRPVKWIEDRPQDLMSINHAREQLHRIEGAFDADGRLLAIRDEVWHNKGAYIRPTGLIVSQVTAGIVALPYRVDAYDVTVHAVMTNKTPVGPYRGPGRYEASFAREQLLNIAADRIGVDPVEIRRINLLSVADIPYRPGLNLGHEEVEISSGDPLGLLERTLETAGYDEWIAERDALRAQGRHVGTSVSCFIDKSGLGVYETAGVEVGPEGGVRVLLGGSSVGQGIETVMAQIAAESLGIDLGRIEVLHGDTDLVPDGVGSWSSRSTVIGGSAVLAAADATADKARRVAARLLEAAPGDLVLDGGRVHVAGSPARGLDLGEIAAACDVVSCREWGEEPGLGAREIFEDPQMNYPYGTVLCQVEVLPGSGQVRLLRCFVGYEVGRAVNPALVEGQIVGGVAQGLGGALLEELIYDEAGQPRATSFMDYLMPTAVEMPPVGTLIAEDAPTPTNPLGAKGAGEAGIIAMGAAVGGAVGDALEAVHEVRRVPVTLDHIQYLIGKRETA